MKYIKLFEKFDSTILTSVLSYLSKKINKNQYSTFLNYLQNMLVEYDIPISKIKDTDVQYLSYNKALKVGSDSISDSKIDYLKYWFSLEDGFVGTTIINNKRINFSSLKYSFNEDMLGWIYGRYEIGGEAIPITHDDLKNMESGDQIMIVTSYEFVGYKRVEFKDFVAIGDLYIDDRKSDNIEYYIFSDAVNANGCTPNYDINGIIRPDNPYNYSYCLYSGDYTELHKIVGNNTDSGLFIKRSGDVEKSPWDFNLPLRGLWKNLSDVSKFESSDFAIILKLDSIISNDSLEDIRSNRLEDRKDVYALIPNEKHRDINFQRYIDKMFNKYGFENSSGEFRNLNNIVMGLSKNILISNDNCDMLYNFSKYLKLFIDDNNANGLENLKSSFEDLKIFYYRNNRLLKNIEYMRNNASKEINDVIIKFMELGNIIRDFVKTNEIVNIYDITAIVYKLNIIKDLSKSNVYKLDNTIMSILVRILSHDVKFVLESSNERYTKEMYNDDIIKIEQLSKFIKSILK